ncbi:MAG: winged helix DNA-binding protein [Gammaproteobacteria bacterium]|nr:winged helix DNA-binding protein [Gammaproteobacteria bacterium]MCW5583782.1 winged helix DNA-binding protein [Gammaproteobacteria bacterium]
MLDKAFGFEKPEDSPGFLLWQTTITWQRLIKKALDPYQISHAQFVILAIVLWFEGVNQEPTQVLITRQSKLDKMTVSKSLKKLVSLGLTKRAEHEKDTRAKSVHLTAKGKSLASKLVPIVEKMDKKFFGVVNAKDQQQLINLLNNIILKNE